MEVILLVLIWSTATASVRGNNETCTNGSNLTCDFHLQSFCGWNETNLNLESYGNSYYAIMCTDVYTGKLKSDLICGSNGHHYLTVDYTFDPCRHPGRYLYVALFVDYFNGTKKRLWDTENCNEISDTVNFSSEQSFYFRIEVGRHFRNDETLIKNISYSFVVSNVTVPGTLNTANTVDHTSTHDTTETSPEYPSTSDSSATSTETTDSSTTSTATAPRRRTTVPPITTTAENLTADNNSKIIIIGASAGGAFIVLLVVILLVVCWRRRMLCFKPHHNQPKTRSPQTRDHTAAYTMWRVDPDGNEGQSNGIANRGFDPESPAPGTAETGLSTPVEQKQACAKFAVKTETVMFAPVKTQQTGANGASKTETEVQETEMPDYAVVKKKTKKQAAARYDYTNVTKPKPNIHPGGGMKLVLPKPDPATKSHNAEETTEEENKKTSLEAETNALIPKSPKSKPTKKSPLLPTDTKGAIKDKGPAGVPGKDKGPAGVLSKDTSPGSNLNDYAQNVQKSPPPVAKKPQVAVKPFRSGNIKVPVLPSDHKLPSMTGLTDQDPVPHKPEQEQEKAGKPHKPHQPQSGQEQEKTTKSNKPQPSSEQKQESQGKPPKVALLPPTMKGKNKAGNGGPGKESDHIQAKPKAKQQLTGKSEKAKPGDVAGVPYKEGNSPKQDLKPAENRNANISAQDKLESNGDKGKFDSTGGSASPDPDVYPQDRLSGIVDDKGQFYFILDKETHEPVAFVDGENSYAVEDGENYACAAEESENYSEIDSHQNHPTKDEMKRNPDRNQNRAGSYYEIAEPLLSSEARPESATYSSIDDQPAELSHTAKEDSADGYYSIADMPSKVAATSEDPAKRDSCYSVATVIAEDNELSTPDDVGGKEDYNYLNFDGKNGAALPVRKDDGEGGEQVYSHLNAGVDEDVYSHTDRDVRKVEVIDDDYSHINIQQQ